MLFCIIIQYLVSIIIIHANLTKINEILNLCAKILNYLYFETEWVWVMSTDAMSYEYWCNDLQGEEEVGSLTML